MKRKGRLHLQVAALPFRMHEGAPQVLLITSRETRRWIIPKGWAEKKSAQRAVAAREAYEEAGLVGTIGKRPVGRYRYLKQVSLTSTVVCKVTVFLLQVEQEMDDFPESAARHRCWLPPDEAADRVHERGLSKLLRARAFRVRHR
jgi:8-oxo-dGTP pyrophosphatase MutT (NUDIX family)